MPLSDRKIKPKAKGFESTPQGKDIQTGDAVLIIHLQQSCLFLFPTNGSPSSVGD